MLASLVVLLSLLTAVPAFAAGGIGDIIIDRQAESRKAVGVGPVVFPHLAHEKVNKCEECHPKLFVKKAGANAINMKLNMSGKFCGAPGCHNSPKAFPLYKCFNCHKKTGK